MDQRAAGAVKHCDLPHDARPLHEHPVDFTRRVARRQVAQHAIRLGSLFSTPRHIHVLAVGNVPCAVAAYMWWKFPGTTI